MSEDKRKHARSSTSGKIRIRTSLSRIAYSVALRNVSKSGAFIHTLRLPAKGEAMAFEILDDYGLRMVAGHGRVVRIIDKAIKSAIGFAIQFDNELDQAMLDYLWALQREDAS